MVSFDFDLPPHGSHEALKSVWKLSSQCWPGSVTEGVRSSSRGWLRRFLMLKLVTALLFPYGDELPLLVGCVFSLRALQLLRSPHISTKPSSVFLLQLARTDALVLLRWLIRLGLTVGLWAEEEEEEEEAAAGTSRALSALSEQLLEAHHLASLLLLGLLGLEATLLAHWPLRTRRFRTSQWARLCCRLAWGLVLLELVCLRHATLSEQQTHLSTLPVASLGLRKTLWVVNSWMHYAVYSFKPRRRKSSFH